MEKSFEKPFWSLQTVFNKSDSVSLCKDVTREDEIKTIKRSWYTMHVDRYGKSQRIRF